MGNREALRELQSRLAQRLNQDGADANAATWLAFECTQQGVVVPLPTAGEIFPLCPLLPVPHTKPWFLGVANLRGQLHGVVDLAAFLGQQPCWRALRLTQMFHRLRRPQAQKGRQIDYPVQLAPQVGDAQEPGLGVRHWQQRAQRKNFTRSRQGHHHPLLGAFKGQPGGGIGVGAVLIQPLRQARLQLP